jgi:hypothetical protein
MSKEFIKGVISPKRPIVETKGKYKECSSSFEIAPGKYQLPCVSIIRHSVV